jgi:hypothetical protein
MELFNEQIQWMQLQFKIVLCLDGKIDEKWIYVIHYQWMNDNKVIFAHTS